MYPRAIFMNRDGVRVDNAWINIHGRRIPIADLREVFIVEVRTDRGYVSCAIVAAIVATSAVVAVVFAGGALRVAWTVGAIATAALATTTVRLRRPAFSIRVVHCGQHELLLESGSDLFVNQIGRALIRAREWNYARNPAIYRITEGPGHVELVMYAATAFMSMTAMLLAAWGLPNVFTK